MDKNYDFSGWATVNDVLCSDGRVIRQDAFKHCDGMTVPLVWNHKHGEVTNVLGHALLENKPEGVYTYCTFNDSINGQTAKELVKHGDVVALSIFANQLKQRGSDVIHGAIREVSLVLAGANPKAYIENVMAHGQESDESAYIFTAGDKNIISHMEDNDPEDTLEHKESEEDEKESKEESKDDSEESIAEIFDSLSDKQKDVVYAMVGAALESDDPGDDEDEDEDPEGGNKTMKHNVFENDQVQTGGYLSHSDEKNIIERAKNKAVGTFQNAMEEFYENQQLNHSDDLLAHGIDEIESLFPDYKDVRPGAPEMITRDQTWVGSVISKTHKSPISRIRTRQADVRGNNLRAYGYKKGNQKKVPGNIKLLKRTTDPQTVYRKDALHRDDIIDITDFDVVAYQYEVMKQNLYEEIAMAIMVGDGREEGDEMKISEEHIRPIWKDDDLYTIHQDVDFAAAKKELQGTNTGANFGENYVYAEAVITAALYSREKYKGSGSLDFYCTPHLLNVMLLARDLNGRRIYASKAELEAALNVRSIQTAEQFEGLVRTTSDSKKKKLLGLFVNLADYQVGSTKGGELTKFSQFDIDFNQEKYLIETRLSGALTRVYSAIALEEDVTQTF